MRRPMSKRKTRQWPNMFPHAKRVHPSIPLQDYVAVSGDCVSCISEPFCIKEPYFNLD